MVIPVANASSTSRAAVYRLKSSNPVIGEVELEGMLVKSNDETILQIEHNSLLAFLSRNMGPGKIFQSCMMEITNNSTENPVWICKIRSDVLGDYSEVGEANSSVSSGTERNYSSTIAQNRAKDRCILFYLNLCLPEGVSRIVSNQEINIDKFSKALPVVEDMRNTRTVPQQNQQSQTQTMTHNQGCHHPEHITTNTGNNKTENIPENLIVYSEATNTPSEEEMNVWKQKEVIVCGQKMSMQKFVRGLEFGYLSGADYIKAVESMIKNGDRCLQYYVSTKKINGLTSGGAK